jgi:hypothetical protein
MEMVFKQKELKKYDIQNINKLVNTVFWLQV